jgi:hypothetical protein
LQLRAVEQTAANGYSLDAVPVKLTNSEQVGLMIVKLEIILGSFGFRIIVDEQRTQDPALGYHPVEACE